MKPLTIKDIAKLAGVNPSTVSRALNNNEDISMALREKIKKIAVENNYKPNVLAVNLRNQKSNIIAMIVPRFSIYFIPSVINGVSKALYEAGYKLMILSSEESLEKEKENIELCLQAGVDGILLSLIRDTKDLGFLDIAKQNKIPVVLYHKVKSQDQFDTCELDNKMVGAMAIEYLKDNQCKNIVGVYGYKQQIHTQLREEGFRENLLPNMQYHSIYGTDSKEIAKEFYKFLIENKNVDGIFAMSDETLIGVHLALQKLDLDETEKPYIVTISDGTIPYYLNKPTKYIKYNGAALGALATNVLLDRIKNNKKEVRQYILPVSEGIATSIFD